MATKKVLEIHKQFIINQLAQFNDNASEITRMLADEEVAKSYNFKPVKVTTQRVGKIIEKIDPAEIESVREIFLNQFDDTPLAFKKMRLIELMKLYNLTNKTPVSYFNNAKDKILTQAQLLRDIKAEIGEDIEKLSDAIKNSGTTNHHHYNFDFGDMEPEDRDAIGRNIKAMLD